MSSFEVLNTGEIRDCLIFLDIDGTLIHDNSADLSSAVLQKVEELKKGNQVLLCSNSRNHERNRKVARQTGAEYLDTDIRKPSRKLLKLVGDSPFSCRLVIGDKFLTDGLFAKRIKADFIKVDRLTSKEDRFFIKFLYSLDDLIYKWFCR